MTVKKRRRKLKKKVKVILFFLIVIIAIIIFYPKKKDKDNNIKEKPVIKEEVKKEDNFNKQCKKISYCNKSLKDRYKSYQKKNKDLSFEDIVTYVNLNLDYSFYTHTKKTPALNKDYILVNKYLYLDKDYVPDNLENIDEKYARSGMKLVSSAKDAFEQMAKSAKKDGYSVIAMSSYRSYDYQVDLYNRYVKSDGVDAADTYSARPGFSEHQTGLCVDIYDGEIDYTNFEKSDSFKWMQENSYKYGFILRFPKDKEEITGYQYESWHYRYVGKKIATYIHNNNITFDEYYVKFIEKTLKEKE